MPEIQSYLTFSGNCREAMTFYKSVFGGVLNFQTVGESPMSEKLPKKIRECILHSILSNGRLVLMGTDMVPENGLRKGNSVSLVLNCNSESEIRKYYKKLSAGGSADHPLKKTIGGDLFGDLTDKYGNHWLLNLPAVFRN